MSGPIVDPGLLSLFRSEVTSHAATIARELEVLERDPAEAALDQLSRAAHAINGAARIVKIAPAEALIESTTTTNIPQQDNRLGIVSLTSLPHSKSGVCSSVCPRRLDVNHESGIAYTS